MIPCLHETSFDSYYRCFQSYIFFLNKFKIELSAPFIQEGINVNNYSFAFLLLVYNEGSFPIHMISFRDPNTEQKRLIVRILFQLWKMRGPFRACIQLCF